MPRAWRRTRTVPVLVLVLLLLGLQPGGLALALGAGGALTGQPLGLLGLDRGDLLGGQRLGDPRAGQSRDRHPEPVRDDRARVRPGGAQLPQPLRRVGLQRVELVAGDDPLAEVGGVASRSTPSFFAAVAGFIVWADLWRVMSPGYAASLDR